MRPNETVARFWSRINHCDGLKKSQFLNGVRGE
jgi:hypothetical protein